MLSVDRAGAHRCCRASCRADGCPYEAGLLLAQRLASNICHIHRETSPRKDTTPTVRKTSAAAGGSPIGWPNGGMTRWHIDHAVRQKRPPAANPQPPSSSTSPRRTLPAYRCPMPKQHTSPGRAASSTAVLGLLGFCTAASSISGVATFPAVSAGSAFSVAPSPQRALSRLPHLKHALPPLG